MPEFVTVETECGPIRGIQKTTCLGLDYVSFLAIPYMKAPIGKLRFRDPQPPEPWNEPFDATKQIPTFPMLDTIFTFKYCGQEDAGVINVFAKDVNKKRPVLVWIHGGGFQMGSSSNDIFGPDYLLQKDVIFVSFNYRLGALGFLSLNDPELEIPGNAGLKDQVLALKWVKKNIEKFGGDPDCITLFGESAGGASVHYHMISEQSKDLFHRAIPMSGSAFCTPWSFCSSQNKAYRLALALDYKGSTCEREILEFLETIDPFEIIKATDKVLTDEEKYGKHMFIVFGPVIEPYKSDNCFIPKSPLEMARNAWSSDINCLIGGLSFEGLLMEFVFELTKDYHRLTFLEDSRYFAPLLDLNLEVDDPKVSAIGKRFKEMYYGITQPSISNKSGFLHYSSDYYFWFGIQRAALIRANSDNKGKTFLYRFDTSTSLNLFKINSKSEAYDGAAHGDDVFYLFKTILLPGPAIESKEFEAIKRFVEIITHFAKTGNPNISKIGDIWEPLDSVDVPLKCLNISNDECSFIPLPESERLNTWNTIFKEAGGELF